MEKCLFDKKKAEELESAEMAFINFIERISGAKIKFEENRPSDGFYISKIYAEVVGRNFYGIYFKYNKYEGVKIELMSCCNNKGEVLEALSDYKHLIR